MNPDPIQLSDSDFRLLFPFHIRIDEEERITSIGDSLQKATHANIGDFFHDFFQVQRPFLANPSFQSIVANTHSLFILETTGKPKMKIRGQWIIPATARQLLFLGSPWFNNLEDLTKQGLIINDFALHDPIIDVLHMSKTHEIGMDDLKEVLARHQSQQKDLKRLSMIATDSINAIIVTNAKGEIEWANKSFEKISGYLLEEVIGRKPGSFLQGPDTDRNTVQYLSRQIKEGKEFSCELLNYRKTGESYWIRITGQPVTDSQGNVEQFFAIEEDITLQKEALLQLSWSEEKYRGIIENMDLGLVEFDSEDGVTYCNNSFSRMIGYPIEELKGHGLAELLKERNINFDASYQLKRRHRGITDVYEAEITTHSGESKWMLVSKALLYDTQRRITGSIGIHLDITWRKKLEIELKQAKLKSEESSKAKEIFLVNMSHEIRTPMNVIMGMSRHLSSLIHDEKQERFLNSIISAADNLLVIINDVLDISKIESGRLEVERISFSIRKSIEEVRQILSFKAEEKGLRLNCEIDEDVPEVLIGDPFRLNQILMNIGGNAIKFTEEGNVDISTYVDKQKDGSVMLRCVIEDTGIGIDQDKLEDVFESFRQESTSISRQYGGSGLGLTISRQLAHLMGGELRIDSLKGTGTRVVLEFPFDIGKHEDLKKPNPILSNVDQLQHQKILVVEDNTMNLTLAEIVLGNFGAEVTTANSGKDALEQLANKSFNLVLMDIRMPVMDGLETTRRMRTDMKINTPVIALTANTSAEVRKSMEEVGINDYLLKPYRESLLLRKIQKVLGIHAPAVPATVSEVAPTKSKLYDTTKLEAFTVKNPDFLKRMLQLFIEETSAGFRDLKAAAGQKDLTKVGDLAHRMKPSIDQLMITGLYEGIKQIEQLAKIGDPDGKLESLIINMDVLMNQVVDQIRANEF